MKGTIGNLLYTCHVCEYCLGQDILEMEHPLGTVLDNDIAVSLILSTGKTVAPLLVQQYFQPEDRGSDRSVLLRQRTPLDSCEFSDYITDLSNS